MVMSAEDFGLILHQRKIGKHLVKVGHKFVVCNGQSLRAYISPVHLDLENDLIQLLYFFSKMLKKLQVSVDPVVVNFFEMHLIQSL